MTNTTKRQGGRSVYTSLWREEREREHDIDKGGEKREEKA